MRRVLRVGRDVKGGRIKEVRVLAGDRYKRNGIPGHGRWYKQRGSVYIGWAGLQPLND